MQSTTIEELWQRKRVYMDALNALTEQQTILVRANSKLSTRPPAAAVREFAAAVASERALEEAAGAAAREYLEYSAKYVSEHPE